METTPINNEGIVEVEAVELEKTDKLISNGELKFANQKIQNPTLCEKILNLNESARAIVESYVINPFTVQIALAKDLGISQGRISQILGKREIQELINDIRFNRLEDMNITIEVEAKTRLLELLRSDDIDDVKFAIRLCFPSGVKSREVTYSNQKTGENISASITTYAGIS